MNYRPNVDNIRGRSGRGHNPKSSSLLSKTKYTDNEKDAINQLAKMKKYHQPDWDNLITPAQLDEIEGLYGNDEAKIKRFSDWVRGAMRVVGSEYLSKEQGEKLISMLKKRKKEEDEK